MSISKEQLADFKLRTGFEVSDLEDDAKIAFVEKNMHNPEFISRLCVVGAIPYCLQVARERLDRMMSSNNSVIGINGHAVLAPIEQLGVEPKDFVDVSSGCNAGLILSTARELKRMLAECGEKEIITRVRSELDF